MLILYLKIQCGIGQIWCYQIYLVIPATRWLPDVCVHFFCVIVLSPVPLLPTISSLPSSPRLCACARLSVKPLQPASSLMHWVQNWIRVNHIATPPPLHALHIKSSRWVWTVQTVIHRPIIPPCPSSASCCPYTHISAWCNPLLVVLPCLNLILCEHSLMNCTYAAGSCPNLFWETVSRRLLEAHIRC